MQKMRFFRVLPAIHALLICLCCIVVGACSQRNAGESTMVTMPSPTEPAIPLFESPKNPAESGKRTRGVTPKFGDQVIYNTDILTFQVHDVYIDSLPVTMTSSQDVILFADVWENGASNLSKNDSLTSVVGISRNQMVPGRMNLSGRVIYGPTEFKGYPLTLRFTLMVLQKEKGQRAGSAADVLGSFASMIPTYGTIVSAALKGARDVLLSQPDIIAFDYEITLLAESPDGLLPTTVSEVKAVPGGMLTAPTKDLAVADSWQIRMPWMRYGMYAVVETRSRNGRAPTPEDKREVTLVPQLAMNGGALVPATDKDGKTKYLTGASDLMRHPPSTSIVFSITPGQRPVDPKALRAASAEAQRQIEEIRQGTGDVLAGYGKISEAAKTIQEALFQTSLDDAARSISTRADGPGEFGRKFQDAYQRMSATLKNDDLTRAAAIYESVREKWVSVYNDVGGKDNLAGDSDARDKAVSAKGAAELAAKVAGEKCNKPLEAACKSASTAIDLRFNVDVKVEEIATRDAEVATSIQGVQTITSAVFAASADADGAEGIALTAADQAQAIAAQKLSTLDGGTKVDASGKLDAASKSVTLAKEARAAAAAATSFAKQAKESRAQALQMQLAIERKLAEAKARAETKPTPVQPPQIVQPVEPVPAAPPPVQPTQQVVR